ncbi:MAG: hypothetical protein AAF738_06525, partial [Bacteroidota bacterium]
ECSCFSEAISIFGRQLSQQFQLMDSPTRAEKILTKYNYIPIILGVLIAIFAAVMPKIGCPLIAISGFLIILGTMGKSKSLAIKYILVYVVVFFIYSLLEVYNT